MKQKNYRLKKLNLVSEEVMTGKLEFKNLEVTEAYVREDFILVWALQILKLIGKDNMDILNPQLREKEIGLEIVLEDAGEELGLSLFWNPEEGIVKEEIWQNGILVLGRNKGSEDDIPVFGQAWDGKYEDLIWERYQAKEDFKFSCYLTKTSTQGLRILETLRERIEVVRGEDIERNKDMNLSTLIYNLRNNYSRILEGVTEGEILEWYNRILPSLGFSDYSVTGTYRIRQGRYDFDLLALGSGLKRLLFLIPILGGYSKNPGRTLYIQGIHSCLHPLVTRELVNNFLPNKKEGTLIVSSCL